MTFRPTEATLFVEKTTAPTANDDEHEGFLVGDLWLDETNDKAYLSLDVSAGAAVWTEVTQGGVTDHGALTGLADDDHPQYIKDSEFAANSEVLVGTGVGTFQKESGAILRTSIGVDPAGTDNSTDVTLHVSAETGGMSLTAQEISNRAATNALTGYATAAQIGEIEANTLKETNVSTDLSEGTPTETTVNVDSSDGLNATLVSASITRAGLLTKAKFDEIVANTSAKHTEGDDQALGVLGTKSPPIDADKVVYRNSVSSDALVTSTWTQVKAFLKTYFDTLYQAVNTAILKTVFTTKGDILVTTGASTPTRLAVGTNTHVLTADSAEASGVKWAAGGGSSSYVKVSDVKAATTQGGTFTLGAWRTRILNTEDSDPDGVCTLSSNQITLSAGTYECLISAPAYKAGVHKARLYNTTGSTTILIGTNSYGAPAEAVQGMSLVKGRFTIAASQALEVQHRSGATQATNGFGVATQIAGVNEVYTIAEFWKVG